MSEPSVDGYSNTPTPLPPAPRLAYLDAQDTKNFALAPWWVFVVSLFMPAIGIMGLCVFVLQIAWLVAGTDTTGQVTGAETYTQKGSTYHRVSYSYLDHGNWVTDNRQEIDEQQYARFSDFQGLAKREREVAVRYVELLGYRQSVVTDLEGVQRHMMRALGMFLIMSVLPFWMYFFVIYEGVMLRFLHRYGQALTGTVVERCADEEGHVVCEFCEPVSGDKIRLKAAVEFQAWRRVKIGRPVTVLYHPRAIGRCAVFEMGGCQTNPRVEKSQQWQEPSE
jgi:hypothetical protein